MSLDKIKEEMLDLPQLQILAQLIDGMENAIQKMELSFNENNAEKFNLAKKEIIDIQGKIDKNITL